MKFDMHILLLVTFLAASLLGTFLPLTGNFGPQTPLQTIIFVSCGILSAFTLGKRVGEKYNG